MKWSYYRPVKTEKAAKSAAYKANMMRAVEPEKPVILLPGAPQKPGKQLRHNQISE